MKRESQIMHPGCSSGLADRSEGFIAALFTAFLVATILAPTATAWTTMNIPGTWDSFNPANTTP
ncbi:MAG TPA: hypothetical protein VNH18_14990, partial [Bryobacteraceae bacterium]|nr:hypothetical protein [Bryobacteraceae bacterium]